MENMRKNEKKRPLYQCWWFWIGLILIAFTVWCRLTPDDSGTVVVGTVGTADSLEEEKQISSSYHEKTDGILYWEGTCGTGIF